MILKADTFGGEFHEETLLFFYKFAFELNHRKEPRKALPIFLFLTQLKPNNFNYWMGLGICYYTDAKTKKALKAFTTAASIAPENPKSYFFMANCHLNLGNFLESFELYKQTKKLSIHYGNFEYRKASEEQESRILKSSFQTLKLLKSLQKKHLPFESAEKFFTFWQGKGEIEILHLLLKLEPTLIKKANFAKSAMNLHFEETHLLLQAKEKTNTPLLEEEKLIKNVLERQLSSFASLDEDSKNRAYYLINALGYEDWVEKLKPEMEESAPFQAEFPPLKTTMDLITAKKSIEQFLIQLRHTGSLLTEKEFENHDKTNYLVKSDQIDRLQGKLQLENFIQKLGLKHIKVPKKIAVLKTDTLTLYIKRDLTLRPERDQLTLYTEKVERVSRKLSLAEALELMILMIKTGYRDFWGDNFLFGKDCIYIVDTAMHGFYIQPNSAFNKIEAITRWLRWLDPKDRPQFLQELVKQKTLFEQEKKEICINPYQQLMMGFLNRPFNFALKNL